jgi:preprotein translocase subunit SecD
VYEWSLPFVLNEESAKRFSEMTFHQCTAVSFTTQGKPVYDCEKTMFFLDKPSALVVLTQEQYDFDEEELLLGNTFLNIPEGTSISEVIEDSKVDVVIYDGTDFNSIYLTEVLKETNQAIVSTDLSQKAIEDLNSFGFVVTKSTASKDTPWIWSTLNAKQIIRLSEGITNEDVTDISQAKIFTQLNISGSRETAQIAFQDLEELAILLESGSLPTPVKSISKETISPSLGSSFFMNVIIMGIVAIIYVSLVIIIRYKKAILAVPIIATLLFEIIIMLGILSLPIIKQPLNLAAFAGIIAAIGTSVDSEVIIVDEIVGKARKEHLSLIQKVKEGLFIITTSVLTMIAVMGPIVLFSRTMPGISNLYGFAVVAIFGGLIGVLITRPAFTKVVEMISDKIDKNQ